MKQPIIENIVPQNWAEQISKIEGDLNRLAGVAESIVVNIGGKNAGTANTVLQQHSKALNDLSAKYTQLAQANQQLTQAEKVETAAATERNRQKEREIALSAQVVTATTKEATNIAALSYTKRELNKISALNVQIQTTEAGSMQNLSAQIALNNITLGKYSQSTIDSSIRLKTLQQETANLKMQLISLGEAQNDHRLKVGHYERALGGTANAMNNTYNSTFQLTQVMRELPNFAIDARVGFMAISNNLPMLADGFTQVMNSMDATTGKMRGFMGAVKVFGRSLLSLNTIIIALSSVMIMLNNNKFTEWLDKLINKTSEAERVQSDFLKSLRDGTGTFKNTLESVYKVESALKLYNQQNIDATAFLAEFNKELGEYFGKQTDATKAAKLFTDNTPAYIEGMRLQAEANIALELAIDAAMKKEAERENTRVTMWQKTGHSFKALGTLVKDAFLNPFAIPDYGRYFRSMSNAEGEILAEREERAKEHEQNERDRLDKHMTLLQESAEKLRSAGLKKNLDDTTKNNDGITAIERDKYEKLAFYSANRSILDRKMYETELRLSKTTADGVLNDYDEREKAAREYYSMSLDLLDIDNREKTHKAEQELKSDEKRISNLSKAFKGSQSELKHEVELSTGERISLTDSMYEQFINAQENYNIAIQESEDGLAVDRLEAANKLASNLYAISSDRYTDEVTALKVSEEEKLKLIEQYARKQTMEREKMTPKDVLRGALGYERDRDFEALAAESDMAAKRLDVQRERIQKQIEAAEDGSETEKQLMIDLAAVERDILQQREDAHLSMLELVAQKTKETYKEVGNTMKEATKTAIDGIFELYDKRDDEQSKRLEKQKEAELSRLDESALTEEALANEKYRINSEYEAKQEALQRKKDKRERDAFLLQQGLALAAVWIKYADVSAAYSLAQANMTASITAASIFAGPIAGPVMAAGAAPAAAAIYEPMKAAALATAGANTALIAAQTIPYFAEGGVMGETGQALVGDASLWGGSPKNELLLYPSGEIALTPDTPTLMTLPKGTTIYPDADNLPSMSDIEKRIIVNSIFKSDQLESELRTLVAETKTLVRLTGGKPKTIDEARMRRQYRRLN